MERYKKIELSGIGSFGDVSSYYDLQNDGKVVAIKSIPFYNKHQALQSYVIREISVLKELDHENVVRLLDVVDDENGFNLVFEHIQLDLAKFIDDHLTIQVNPQLIKYFLFQILQGVSYCHSQKVMHRDLKPHNLLLDLKSSRLKLADFGLARTFEVPLPKYSRDVTTYQYRAPELLLEIPYSAPVDMWAVGCIFAEMVIKQPLFNLRFEEEILVAICRMNDVVDVLDKEEAKTACQQISQTGMLPSMQMLATLVPGLEAKGLDLLAKMLCVNPNRRITALDALSHPYFEDLQVNF